MVWYRSRTYRAICNYYIFWASFIRHCDACDIRYNMLSIKSAIIFSNELLYKMIDNSIDLYWCIFIVCCMLQRTPKKWTSLRQHRKAAEESITEMESSPQTQRRTNWAVYQHFSTASDSPTPLLVIKIFFYHFIYFFSYARRRVHNKLYVQNNMYTHDRHVN